MFMSFCPSSSTTNSNALFLFIYTFLATKLSGVGVYPFLPHLLFLIISRTDSEVLPHSFPTCLAFCVNLKSFSNTLSFHHSINRNFFLFNNMLSRKLSIYYLANILSQSSSFCRRECSLDSTNSLKLILNLRIKSSSNSFSLHLIQLFHYLIFCRPNNVLYYSLRLPHPSSIFAYTN